MAQPSQHAQSVSLHQGAGFDTERGKKTPGAIFTALPTNEGASAPTGPYRLYKRRWVGVFAMVSTCTTIFFFLM